MMGLKIESLTVGDQAANCWFLIKEDTMEALAFDTAVDP